MTHGAACGRVCSRAAALGMLRDAGQLHLQDFQGVWPRPTIAPTDPMPVVRLAPPGPAEGPAAGAGSPTLAPLSLAAWGKPGSDLSTTHARADRVADSPLWAPLLCSPTGRAVAVVSHGWEPFTARTVEQMGRAVAVANVGPDAVQAAEAGTTVWHGFRRQDGAPMLLACLVDVADGAPWLSLVTVPSGPVLARVHRAKQSGEPREAALLREGGEALAWLQTGDVSALRGATDAELTWWRTPDGCMARDADPLLKTQAWRPGAQRRLF